MGILKRMWTVHMGFEGESRQQIRHKLGVWAHRDTAHWPPARLSVWVCRRSLVLCFPFLHVQVVGRGQGHRHTAGAMWWPENGEERCRAWWLAGVAVLDKHCWKDRRLVGEEPGCGVTETTLVQDYRKAGFVISACRRKWLSGCKACVLK